MESKLFESTKYIDAVKSMFPTNKFYIAGGAVRDFLNNKEISDVDVYTNLQSPALINTLKKMEGYKTHKLINNQYINRTVLNIDFEDLSMDFIYCARPLRDIMSFDVGLCMCFLDNSYSLHLSDEYKKDVANKTITIYPTRLTMFQIARSVDYHIPKLMKKYPDFKVRIDYEQDT